MKYVSRVDIALIELISSETKKKTLANLLVSAAFLPVCWFCSVLAEVAGILEVFLLLVFMST